MNKKIKYTVGLIAIVCALSFLCLSPVNARICFAPSSNCDDNFGTRVDNCDKHNWQEDENCDAGQIAVAKEIINGVQCYACEQRKTCADHGYPFSEEPCRFGSPYESVYNVHSSSWQYFCCESGEQPTQVVVDDLVCYECKTPEIGYDCFGEYMNNSKEGSLQLIQKNWFFCADSPGGGGYEDFCRRHCKEENGQCIHDETTGRGSEFEQNCCDCSHCKDYGNEKCSAYGRDVTGYEGWPKYHRK